MRKTIVFSLGGSLIAPKNIDTKFLAGFRRLILDFVRRGNHAIIICGGGNTARLYAGAARALNAKASSTELDWLGIEATKLNAWLVRDVFGNAAEHKLLYDPTKRIKTTKRLIIGSGWKPGCSSDKDAVLAAKTYRVNTVVNLSNITYVYDRDPKKYPGAKPQPRLTWQQFQKIVGTKWVPGAHAPFDPVASTLARQSGMTLVIMQGSDLANLKQFLNGQQFRGSVISD